MLRVYYKGMQYDIIKSFEHLVIREKSKMLRNMYAIDNVFDLYSHGIIVQTPPSKQITVVTTNPVSAFCDTRITGAEFALEALTVPYIDWYWLKSIIDPVAGAVEGVVPGNVGVKVSSINVVTPPIAVVYV